MQIDKKKYYIDGKGAFPQQFMHEERGMAITLDLSFEEEEIYLLQINDVCFGKLPEAPVREREPLARSNT